MYPYILVDTSLSGQDAIEKVKLFKENNEFYSIILMDINMPIMDGFQTTSEILKLLPENS